MFYTVNPVIIDQNAFTSLVNILNIFLGTKRMLLLVSLNCILKSILQFDLKVSSGTSRSRFFPMCLVFMQIHCVSVTKLKFSFDLLNTVSLDLNDIPCTDFFTFCLQLEPQLRILANFQVNPNNNPNPSRLSPFLILLSDFFTSWSTPRNKTCCVTYFRKTKKRKIYIQL